MLHVGGLVSLTVSRPYLAGWVGLVVFVALVIALDVPGWIREVLLRRRLKQVESLYPGSRATELSNGRILLTDRGTGATVRVVSQKE